MAYAPTIVGLGFIAVFVYVSYQHEIRKSADGYVRSGTSYAIAGDYERAISDFSEAIRIDPGYVVPFIERGNVYGVKQDFDRASADFTEAMRLAPDHADSLGLYRRGLMKMKSGDIPGGRADMVAARQALGAAVPR